MRCECGKKNMKKVKCVKSNVVARTITFDNHMQCLNEEIKMTRWQSCIRSKLHQIYTIRETKIVLSSYDDKRYIIPEATDMLVTALSGFIRHCFLIYCYLLEGS